MKNDQHSPRSGLFSETQSVVPKSNRSLIMHTICTFLALSAGTCDSGPAQVTCEETICAPRDSCHIGQCEPQTSACLQIEVANGTLCAEGGCWAGVCRPAKVQLMVLNGEGEPVPQANVSWHQTQYSTDTFGHLTLDVNKFVGHSIAVISASGYASSSAVFDVRPGAHEQIVVRLLGTNPPSLIDPGQASQVKSDGVQIDLPAGGLVDSAGTAVSGPVRVAVTPLDPTTDRFSAMPGPLEGLLASEDRRTSLRSIFMAEVSLWQGDKPLQLKRGMKARLEFPIPAAMQRVVNKGDSIPAWWFDLEAGIWRQDGDGEVKYGSSGQLIWVSQVGHFTWWNADYPLDDARSLGDLNCLDVEVVDAQSGLILEEATVTAKTEDTDIFGVYANQAKTGMSKPTGGGVLVERACVNSIKGKVTRLMARKANYTQTEVILEAPTPAGYSSVGSTQSGLLMTAGSGANCTLARTTCAKARIKMAPLACLRINIDPPLPDVTASVSYHDGLDLVNRTAQIGIGGKVCMQVPKLTDLIAHATHTNNDGYTTYAESPQINVTNVNSTACSPTGADDCKVVSLGPLNGCSGVAPCPAKWTAFHGDNQDQQLMALAAAPGDPNGTIYIGGKFKGTLSWDGCLPKVNSDPSSSDLFVAKLSNKGRCEWLKTAGDSDEQTVTSLAVDSAGNLLIAGIFKGKVEFDPRLGIMQSTDVDSFVAKLASDGTALWQNQIRGTNSQVAVQVLVDRQGVGEAHDAVLLLGHFMSELRTDGYSSISKGANDLFGVAYTANGSYPMLGIRGMSAGGGGDDTLAAATIDGDHNVLLVGEYGASFSFAPLTTALAYHGGKDGFVAKVNSTGGALWQVALNEGSLAPLMPGDQRPAAVLTTAANDVIIAGSYSGVLDVRTAGEGPFTSADASPDVFVAQLSKATGQPMWAKSFGALGEQRVTDLAWDLNQNLLVAGMVQNELQLSSGAPTQPLGPQDLFIARLDPSNIGMGKALTQRRYGAPSVFITGPRLAVNQAQHLLLMGATLSGAGTQGPNFGSGNMPRGGGLDIVLAAFDPKL